MELLVRYCLLLLYGQGIFCRNFLGEFSFPFTLPVEYPFPGLLYYSSTFSTVICNSEKHCFSLISLPEWVIISIANSQKSDGHQPECILVWVDCFDMIVALTVSQKPSREENDADANCKHDSCWIVVYQRLEYQ